MSSESADVYATVNNASRHARNLQVFFVLVCLYAIVMIGATADRDILIGTTFNVPVVNGRLPLVAFYLFIPVLVLCLHVNLLLHHLALGHKLAALAKTSLVDQDTEAGQRLSFYPFTYLFLDIPLHQARAVTSKGQPAVADNVECDRQDCNDWSISLMKASVRIGLEGFPLLALLAFQIRFVPYHSVGITLWHQTVVVADVLLLGLFYARLHSISPISSCFCYKGLRHNSFSRTANLAAGCVVFMLLAATLYLGVTGLAWLGMHPRASCPSRPYVRGVYVSQMHTALATVAILFAVWAIPRLCLELPNFVVSRIDVTHLRNRSRWARILFKTSVVDFRSVRHIVEAALVVLFSLGLAGIPDRDFLTALPRSSRFRALVECVLHKNLVLSNQCFSKGALDTQQSVFLRQTKISADVDGAVRLVPSLEGRDLRFADFTGCTLSGMDLRGANLAGAVLQEANLRGADLSVSPEYGPVVATQAWFPEADLRHVDFRSACLSGCVFVGADLSGASLQHADLEGIMAGLAKFHGAHVGGARLQGACLMAAKFDGADLQGAQLHLADLSLSSLVAADLRKANLTGSVISGADLSGATLRGAVLTAVKMDCLKSDGKQPPCFDYADLRGIILESAIMQGSLAEVARKVEHAAGSIALFSTSRLSSAEDIEAGREFERITRPYAALFDQTLSGRWGEADVSEEDYNANIMRFFAETARRDEYIAGAIARRANSEWSFLRAEEEDRKWKTQLARCLMNDSHVKTNLLPKALSQHEYRELQILAEEGGGWQ